MNKDVILNAEVTMFNERKYRAYADQKGAAMKRGIDWNFTYKEWVEWWGDDFENRGVGKNNLVMARYNDTGPYEKNNVKKITFSENVKEAKHLGKRHKPITFEGVTYNSILEAMEKTGYSRYKIYRNREREIA